MTGGAEKAMNLVTFPSGYDAVRTLSAEALLQELRSDVPVTLIDVRERQEIQARGTLEGARRYPLSELGARIAELDDLRSTSLVVISERGNRAREAARELASAGFGEVFALEGGIVRWLELGHPMEVRGGIGRSAAVTWPAP